MVVAGSRDARRGPGGQGQPQEPGVFPDIQRAAPACGEAVTSSTGRKAMQPAVTTP